MKSQEFGSLLKAFAEVLDTADARRAKDNIVTLSAVFDVSPNSTVSEVVKCAKSITISQNSRNPTLADVGRLLSPLGKLVAKTAKSGVVADIDRVEALLHERGSADLNEFVRVATQALTSQSPGRRTRSTVRDDLVTEYHAKLQTYLGDQENFAATYQHLASNNEMGKAELVALAKRFTGMSVRSKAEAMKKIWHRHQNLMVSKAKDKATGGRSAA